jgi:hypothetical protein
MEIWPLLGFAAGASMQPLYKKHVIGNVEHWLKRHPGWWNRVLLCQIGNGNRRRDRQSEPN